MVCHHPLLAQQFVMRVEVVVLALLVRVMAEMGEVVLQILQVVEQATLERQILEVVAVELTQPILVALVAQAL
jgi:hypothetical protein